MPADRPDGLAPIERHESTVGRRMLGEYEFVPKGAFLEPELRFTLWSGAEADPRPIIEVTVDVWTNEDVEIKHLGWADPGPLAALCQEASDAR